MQEVATRLLSVWHKVDRTKESWPLVVTIALNLLRDRSRKRIFEVLCDLPELPTADAAEAGIARVELGEVFRAMEALTPLQRAALLRALEPSREAASTAADKMLRLRARRRLANAVGRASAGIALRFRRTSDALHALFAKGDGLVQALTCATCLFVTTAGAASLAPGFDPFIAEAKAGVVMIDGAEVDAGNVPTSYVSAAQAGAEVLRPDRNAYTEIEVDGKGRAVHTGGEAPAGTTTLTGPSGLPIPGNAPIPNGDDVPAPPSPPSAPDQPTAPELEADVPEGPGPNVPLPEAEDVVEAATGALDKVNR